MPTEKKPPPPNGQNPLIPEKYVDVPSQRLYYLSLGLLCQAIKFIEFSWTTVAGTDESLGPCAKWLLVDALYCITLAVLKIPRLNYGKAVIFLQISTLWFLDGLMFGGLSLNFGGGSIRTRSYGHPSRPDLITTPEPFNLIDLIAPYSFGLLTPSLDKDAHLLGQHTVRMSPISTAQLYPNGQTFCLSSHSNSVLIPVLLNNTSPYSLKYSISPLGRVEGGDQGKTEYFDLNAKELKAIEHSRMEALQVARPNTVSNYDSDDYEYDEEEETDTNGQSSKSDLQKSQSVHHIKISKPGILRLERVLDSSNIEARLTHPAEIKVAPCPSADFVEDDGTQEEIRCIGQDPEFPLAIDILGVAPLSLKWSKSVNGEREHFLVEGIEGEHGRDDQETRTDGVQNVQVPLVVTLDKLGTHEYVLEEIIDAIGNVVSLSANSAHASKVSRSFRVLHRPRVSFKSCAEGRPVPLLIGSEASLTLSTNEADPIDGPWDVVLNYQPPTNTDEDGKESKKYKPWRKTLKTQEGRRELSIKANAPGQYSITGIKGKFCNGDVLSPEKCNVVERPFPTAEIEWKRIHECSGDTGVSASIVFHGTPPFTVHYQTKRDAESARDQVKTFNAARGELTLQPERSGHYVYKFTHLSDANYKKVELDGPSIDQNVHPLATAEFAGATTGVSGVAGKRKVINVCEGESVNADVDLRGTGPWNLELQIVGPRKTETIKVQNVTSARKTLEIPIPKSINKEGGSFEVDLVSIEDAYACKRPLSGPGIFVNVRRVKPTVKFYGKDGERRVVVLERERASLPLRLSGEAPWKLRYHRIGGDEVLSTMLSTPNDYLHVTQKGTYELLDVSDSQCPGWVVDGSTYEVDWVPRPYAKLSPKTENTYEPFNNSHILVPICEGVNAHVDLDLSGRPPFQIMYNIAQDAENGGTKLLDQPIFNSIQAQTRFQLHTSRPGRMYYEVKQIGDAAYPLARHKNAIIPRSERLLFEQQVSIRPSAWFRSRQRLSYCLNEAFVPSDQPADHGVVILEGSPPFTLKMSIRSIGTSHIHTETVQVMTKVWDVNIPSYTFQTIGAHIVKIESVLDASRCAQADLDPLSTSIWVDVAETASIVPFERRTDYCVGEVSQFQLEGIPPWSIGYRINGKVYMQEAKTSPFSLLHQQSGEFAITSISHQKQMCKAPVHDMTFNIHPLPSAQVGHGKRIFQDIHEGDQAEIVFTLIGEPPFTFTYQRAEASPKKGGKPGKVLETHTVSRVNTHEYSIFSALEGTWTVTSISDRYCRYPQAQSEIGTERRRI